MRNREELEEKFTAHLREKQKEADVLGHRATC
jgi:hypothetical protein